ncbi:MAG: DUF2937 family protein [Pseudomonadota bacterium]
MLFRLASTLSAVVSGGLTSQFPEFYQQYRQRLGGHLDQAKERMTEITVDAQSKDLSVKDYIQSFLDSPAHTLEGQRMQDSFVTVERLSMAETALQQASLVGQPATFAQHFDPTLAQAVAETFQPAFPLTPAGLIYGGAGALLGWLILITGRRLFRRKSSKEAPA